MINELENLTKEEINAMPRKGLEALAWHEKQVISHLKAELLLATEANEDLKANTEYIAEMLERFKKMLFAASSEKTQKDPDLGKKSKGDGGKSPGNGRKLPSERYPNISVVEKLVAAATLPNCPCCGDVMSDSGLREVTEQLTVIPKRFEILRLSHVKYHCNGCRSGLVTIKQPRICPGSAFSDDFIIDIAVAKYADLVPMERYCEQAARDGATALVPHSLIGLTHKLAAFLAPVVRLIKKSLLSAQVLHADETPHRMLEGDETKNWFLWGFCDGRNSYFEIHATRSGDVASELLKNSSCHSLVSDVFSGYAKAVRVANSSRKLENQIFNAYCNAHSRRRFVEAQNAFPQEAAFYLNTYQEIYRLESESKNAGEAERSNARLQMRPLFEQMLKQGKQDLAGVSAQSGLARAIDYFNTNYDGLTRCLLRIDVPLDNNLQERQIRKPVIGRKTWYGTHSKLGAETAALLFTIMQSCQLNSVSPRAFITYVVESMLKNGPPITPWEFSQLKN